MPALVLLLETCSSRVMGMAWKLLRMPRQQQVRWQLDCKGR